MPSTVKVRPARFVCTVTWTVGGGVGVGVGVAVAVGVGVGVGVFRVKEAFSVIGAFIVIEVGLFVPE
jgi:hypothetical protein